MNEMGASEYFALNGWIGNRVPEVHARRAKTLYEALGRAIAQSLVESSDFDLIAMGRPEGPGCYCFANNALRTALKEIADDYPYVVLDNEAGLENLSRRIVQKVNWMVLVTDPSARGLATVARLFDLTREMGTAYEKLAIVVNRLRRADLPSGIEDLRAHTAADLIVGLPDDAELADLAEAGGGVDQLSAANAVVRKIDGFLSQIMEPQRHRYTEKMEV